MSKQFPDVATQYGAPMGRKEYGDVKKAHKVRLFKVRINSGGYDDGNAYWGTGLPLYCAESQDGLHRAFVRAKDRADAREKLGLGVELYYKADLVSIDAWREDGGWTWNASYFVERDIIFADSAITTRRVLNFMRKAGYLTHHSVGKVRATIGEWPIVEIQLKGTGQPLFALMFNETPCGKK